ncbi:MAG TPA: zf-HC2 domain-containing protein [Terriglobales bacterium]|nr:zf-HC2 domain-containing protein [Terriglobales bacterium]
MNCHDARELLSALLDDTLDARERSQVQAHLEGCADCRRELDSLRSTVSLLSRVERARAPLGFVDRVMAGVHPVPWYRRLGRLVFLPLSVKLPIEAGAMLVIALLGVYLLQSTPELKDAARPDLPAMTSREEAPPAAPAPAPSIPAPAPLREREAKLKSEAHPASGGDGERANMARPPEGTQAPSEARQEGQGVLRQSAPPASEPAKPEAPSPRSSLAKALGSREGSADRADAARKSAPAAAPPVVSSASQQLAPPVVSGVLTVKDRQQAERALADLISRTGARETGRRPEDGATVVEVLVPQAGYAGFTKELGRLGAFRIEGQAAEGPASILLSIRISSE